MADDRTKKSKPHRLLGISATYLAMVLALLFARHGVAESTWWSTLILYAPPLLYGLPLLALLPIAALRRDRGSLVILAGSAFLAMGPLMGAVAHDPLNTTQYGNRRVRLLSYNIHSGDFGFDKIAGQLARYVPDIVVLSEARDLRRIDTLPPELRHVFAGWQCVVGDDLFIASRWPIVAREITPMGGDTRRSRVRATIRSPHGDFHLIGVHYYTHLFSRQAAVKADFRQVMLDSADARLRQTREVLRAAADLKGPILLAGDFNNPPAGKAYAMLRDRFQDSHRRAGWGWGYTFPAAFPIWRIDYVFYNSWWNIVRTEVGPASGSDHRPLFAEFSLDRNNNGT